MAAGVGGMDDGFSVAPLEISSRHDTIDPKHEHRQPIGDTELVSVHLMNGTHKVFRVDDACTFGELDMWMADKLDLTDEGRAFFSVHYMRGGFEERPPRDELVLNLFTHFADDDKVYKKNKQTKKFFSPSRFVYKKWLFSMRREHLLTDLPALTLLYYEAKHNIVNSIIPCHGPDAMELAGYQMQFEYGDFTPDKAATDKSGGFLIKGGRLDDFVPKRALKSKAHTKLEWESVIFQHYAEHAGMEQSEALIMYLRVARRSPFYGCVMSQPAKVYTVDGAHVERVGPDRMQLAIAPTAIILVDPLSQKTLWQFPFKALKKWGIPRQEEGGPPPETFGFEVFQKGRVERIPPFCVETVQAVFLDQALQTAVTQDQVKREEEALAAFKSPLYSPPSGQPKTPEAAAGAAADKWIKKTGLTPSASRSASRSDFPEVEGGSSSDDEGGSETREPVYVRDGVRFEATRTDPGGYRYGTNVYYDNGVVASIDDFDTPKNVTNPLYGVDANSAPNGTVTATPAAPAGTQAQPAAVAQEVVVVKKKKKRRKKTSVQENGGLEDSIPLSAAESTTTLGESQSTLAETTTSELAGTTVAAAGEDGATVVVVKKKKKRRKKVVTAEA